MHVTEESMNAKIDFILFLSLFSFFISGCTLSYNISDLNQNYNQSNEIDKTTPSLTGSIIDGTSFGSLSTTPNLLWPSFTEAKNGFSHYELAIGSSYGAEDILMWTPVGSNTNYSHSGLSLTKGHPYYPKIRAVDTRGNKSPVIFGDGWIATTLLSFLQPKYSLITGESITLTVVGGESPYNFQNSASGYLNTNSGTYTAPLNLSPASEQITAIDSVSQQSQTTVNIRAFEDKNIFRSPIYQPEKPNAPGFIVANSTNILFASGSAQDSLATTHAIIRKSTDGGISWELIEDYQYSTGKYATYSQILFASNSEIYVVASNAYDNSNVNHWVVRKSIDAGFTWNTVDDFMYAAANTYSTSIAKNSLGHIFVTGYGSGNWFIRKSTDNGTTWNTIDTFTYLGFGASPSSIKIDDTSGHIYVSGSARDASSVNYWLVRKSSDNGASWTTIDTFQLFAGKYSSCLKLVISGSNIFSAGIGLNNSDISNWVVRRSSDGGASWTTVDTYNLAISYSAFLSDIYSPTASTLFTIGSGIDSTNKSHWIVRKSTDNGNTWVTVNDFLASALSNVQASGQSITADNLGNLYSIGTGQVFFTDINHWFTQKSTDAGISWITIDDYSYTRKGENKVMSLAYDSNNKILYSAGYEGPINYSTWIVRKSNDNGNTWVTIDSYQMYKYSKAIAYKVFIKGSDLYTLGNATDNNYLGHWIVRKSTDGGISWNNIDSWAPYVNNSTTAKAIAFDSSGNIYVGGYVVDSSSFYQRWIVRKSSNNGASWTVVDNYAPNYINSLNDIIVTASNEIIATGNYLNPSSQTTWLVRKSNDGGGSWTNIDTYQMVSSKTSVANMIFVNSSNEIFITGYALDASNNSHSIVRKSTDNGISWNTIYNYQLTPTKDSSGIGFAIDSSNYFYTLSNAKDTSGTNHIITQKSTDSGSTWVTIDNYSSIDTSKTHSGSSIVPCFTNQICIGGSRSIDNDPINQGIVRILSPVP